ncbi:MAG: 3-phosphoshikimate 1-carboxyvinyltransferase, partial [Bacteroidetes bacterium]|nr:3-phosphoshikimate 1-carboxyvinyltransferase [Bacteroidota bacterium]
MIATIEPGRLKGAIRAAASKSSMQRACAAALLTGGVSVIHNPGHSNDDKAALDIIRRLGAVIESDGDTLRITGKGVKPVSPDINCGESGLSIRMFTPLVALSEQEVTVNGSGSLVTRPMDFFDEVLPMIGATVKSNKGRLPLVIKGPVKPQNITIDGSLSSQFLTGLLMAYAAADATDVSITVTNLKSRPYIDLTLKVMEDFGLKLPENRNYESFYFGKTSHDSRLTSHDSRVTTHDYTVEGDWSGGAFLLVAGAIAGDINVSG